MRQADWPPEIVDEIARLRKEHPNLGKKKIHPLLARFCAARRLWTPSVATIGRIIAAKGGMRTVPARLDNRGRPKKPRPIKPRKPKGYRPDRPGDLLGVDTIIVLECGFRRAILAAVDIRTRFAFALAVASATSRWASFFLEVCLQVLPIPVRQLLSDNGSEFEGQFRPLAEARGLKRMFTFPRTPKMNAHVERFNRTIQEEFVAHHEALLFSDEHGLAEFNRLLAEWLIWYNTERPHQALGGRTPVEALVAETTPRLDWVLPGLPLGDWQPQPAPLPGPRSTPSDPLMPPPPDCQTYWARTGSCSLSHAVL